MRSKLFLVLADYSSFLIRKPQLQQKRKIISYHKYISKLKEAFWKKKPSFN